MRIFAAIPLGPVTFTPCFPSLLCVLVAVDSSLNQLLYSVASSVFENEPLRSASIVMKSSSFEGLLFDDDVAQMLMLGLYYLNLS